MDLRRGAVENLVTGFWRGRRVLITGHSGFKGSWLSLWLQQLGAEVCGIGLPPLAKPSLFSEAGVDALVRSEMTDIRDLEKTRAVFSSFRPEIVFHMAAQPLVRASYDDPAGTYATNVLGTAHVLEAVRRTDSVRAVVVITTDKCYENKEWVWAYRENDRLGGHDPYSSSKACAELVVSSFRDSFFNPDHYEEHGVAVATARAGNVIGGGDWSKDRLIPDIMRAFTSGQMVQIRHPDAIRPWQHVLEPLWGYMQLAQFLVEHGAAFGEPWNFGPQASDAKPVRWIVEQLAKEYGQGAKWQLDENEHPHEAGVLKLDWSKAESRLQWRPMMSIEQALRLTGDWYRRRHDGAEARSITLEQIATFAELLPSNANYSITPLSSCGK